MSVGRICKREVDLVDPDEQAGIFDSIFATGACVIREGGTYKAWYTGWNGQTEHVGGGISKKINFRIGYATSPDGIRWTKVPGSAGAGAVLGLGDAGSSDAKGVAHPHVLNIGGTYRMWYEGYDGTTWRLFAATSPDGVNWTQATGNPVFVAAENPDAWDRASVSAPSVIQTACGSFHMWYGAKGDYLQIGYATSSDGSASTGLRSATLFRSRLRR